MRNKKFIVVGSIVLAVGIFFLTVTIIQALPELTVGTIYYTGKLNPIEQQNLIISGTITLAGAVSLWYGLTHRNPVQRKVRS